MIDFPFLVFVALVAWACRDEHQHHSPPNWTTDDWHRYDEERLRNCRVARPPEGEGRP